MRTGERWLNHCDMVLKEDFRAPLETSSTGGLDFAPRW